MTIFQHSVRQREWVKFKIVPNERPEPGCLFLLISRYAFTMLTHELVLNYAHHTFDLIIVPLIDASGGCWLQQKWLGSLEMSPHANLSFLRLLPVSLTVTVHTGLNGWHGCVLRYLTPSTSCPMACSSPVIWIHCWRSTPVPKPICSGLVHLIPIFLLFLTVDCPLVHGASTLT